jgi:predicted flap endonuclease-1-like 5' DNA nuclease
MANLKQIEGIGEAYAAKLFEIGLVTTEALLNKGATPEGRKEIQEQTGIAHEKILDWVNRADLFRIKGVAEEYSDLLEAAGVDTVPELAQRNPVNLLNKLTEINTEKHLVRRLPTQREVSNWVENAKVLPRRVTY